MKQRFLRLLSVFILVLPLLAACGSLDNQATSKVGEVGQKAMVAAQAQTTAHQAAQLPNQSEKTAQQVSSATSKTLSNLFADLPDRITTVQRESKLGVGSWWQNITKKLSERQKQMSGSTSIHDKQPKPY